MARQLEAAQHPHSASIVGVGVACGGVVIGEAEDVGSIGLSSARDLGRLEGTVGATGVAVELEAH
jgi:hypothetical protein